ARRAAVEVKRVLKPAGLFYCDLRSTEDYEYGLGREVGRNTFVLTEGFEKGLPQHFFSADDIEELFGDLFKTNYTEITENRIGPDFKRKFSRWVLALEALQS